MGIIEGSEEEEEDYEDDGDEAFEARPRKTKKKKLKKCKFETIAYAHAGSRYDHVMVRFITIFDLFSFCFKKKFFYEENF